SIVRRFRSSWSRRCAEPETTRPFSDCTPGVTFFRARSRPAEPIPEKARYVGLPPVGRRERELHIPTRRGNHMNKPLNARTLGTLGAVVFALFSSLATAQVRDQYGQYGQNGQYGEMRQTVARISFLSG